MKYVGYVNMLWKCIPDSATSSTETPISLARYPRKEKMTNPAKNEVKQLLTETINASLDNDS